MFEWIRWLERKEKKAKKKKKTLGDRNHAKSTLFAGVSDTRYEILGFGCVFIRDTRRATISFGRPVRTQVHVSVLRAQDNACRAATLCLTCLAYARSMRYVEKTRNASDETTDSRRQIGSSLTVRCCPRPWLLGLIRSITSCRIVFGIARAAQSNEFTAKSIFFSQAASRLGTRPRYRHFNSSSIVKVALCLQSASLCVDMYVFVYTY